MIEAGGRVVLIGATTISAGTLALSGAGSLATSRGVADSGTLDISQTGSGRGIRCFGTQHETANPGLPLAFDRPTGLLLDDSRPVLHPAAHAYIANPQAYEVAAPELTVDRKVEQREIAFALLKLKPDADCSDFSGPQRALLTDEAAFVPRAFAKADK